MCGITGFMKVGKGRRELPSSRVLDDMTDTLEHRGPDARGIWYDAGREVGLGHRRLSIRDLSPTGAQPMVSSCERFVIVYNGEVYSDKEIAADLGSTGRQLRGHSDTEVILEACAEWGIEHVAPRLIGMFAIAIFDRLSGDLVLVRDRLGIKPVYWSMIDGLFCFGSELKALRAVPGWRPTVDRSALASFMRHNYIPAPLSIYKDVRKLEPGTLLRVARDGSVTVKTYWNLRSIVESKLADHKAISDGDAIDRLDHLLTDAVRRRDRFFSRVSPYDRDCQRQDQHLLDRLRRKGI
jgi:asparagine synthase (glutamine-hydrolysing)